MYNLNSSPETDLHIKKIQEKLVTQKSDALLITTNSNLFYVMGSVFAGAVYIPQVGDALIFVRRPVGVGGNNVFNIRKIEDIVSLITQHGIAPATRWSIEGDAISYTEFQRYASLFPHITTDATGSQLLRSVRTIKSPYEIALMRQSAYHHTAVYKRIPSLYKEGMRDIDFSIEIEREIRKEGSLGIFRIFGSSMEIFMGSVVSGTNADAPSPYDFALGGAGINRSLPVGSNGSPIMAGNTVLVDIGGNFTGYMTDMSRTFSVGDIPLLAEKAHLTSIAIADAIAETGKPGISVSSLYQMAIEMALKAGLGDYFMGHTQKAAFIGHGIGIEINEPPVLTLRSEELLEENMIIALEPKFVIPNVGAVGIEDSYLVTATGLERLTYAPREILPLGIVKSTATRYK